MKHTEEAPAREPIINFRPFLFSAIGVIFGVILFSEIKFGHFTPAYLLLPILLTGLALFPISLKRTLSVLLCFLLFAGVGAGAFAIYDSGFSREQVLGEVTLSGTVTSVSEKEGYSYIILENISFDGERHGGKCRLRVNATDVLPADMLVMDTKVSPLERENFFADPFVRQLYAKDVRYLASSYQFEKIGESSNPFLRLNAALHERLFEGMGREEASVAYGMLTGNSTSMDEGLLDSVRTGGIAHIFAVSGLHIGILFGAAVFLFRPLRKYRVLPAIGLCLLYCALCNFTVSSVRALIMCSVGSVLFAFGKKSDFLDTLSLSAVIILVSSPAQWYAAGFLLSFGACLGLALFRKSFECGFKKCHIPNFIGKYLAANLSVEVVLFPIQMDCFGYFPPLGILMNLIIVPILPVLFLGLLLSSIFALILPFWASFFLAAPEGALSLFLFVLANADFRLIIAGFSLGMGSAVFLIGCVMMSQRVRLRPLLRGTAAVLLSVLFTLTVVDENVISSGFRAEYYAKNDGQAVLIRTRGEDILVIGAETSYKDCEELLLRRASSFDLVVTLDEGLDAVNTAAFLPAEKVIAFHEAETGFQEEDRVMFCEEYTCGEVFVRYLSSQKALIFVGESVLEVDFQGEPTLGADFFLGNGTKSGKYRF